MKKYSQPMAVMMPLIISEDILNVSLDPSAVNDPYENDLLWD